MQSTTTRRKHIRIALSKDDERAMSEAKRAAEEETGIAMSDSLYVLSVLRKALQDRSRKDGRGM